MLTGDGRADTLLITQRKEPQLTTYAEAANRTGTHIPDHIPAELADQLRIKVVDSGFGRQGDVCFLHVDLERPAVARFIAKTEGQTLTGKGVKLVESDTTQNAHIAQSEDPRVLFYRGLCLDNERDVGVIVMPSESEVVITHTDEHEAEALRPAEQTSNVPTGDLYAFRVFQPLDQLTKARAAD